MPHWLGNHFKASGNCHTSAHKPCVLPQPSCAKGAHKPYLQGEGACRNPLTAVLKLKSREEPKFYIAHQTFQQVQLMLLHYVQPLITLCVIAYSVQEALPRLSPSAHSTQALEQQGSSPNLPAGGCQQTLHSQ